MKTLKLTSYVLGAGGSEVYILTSKICSIRPLSFDRTGTKLTLDSGESVEVIESVTTVLHLLEGADGLTGEVIHGLATSCASAVARARRYSPVEFDQLMSIEGFVKVIKEAL